MAHVDKVSASNLTARDFISQFADPGRPVILLDIVPDWPAYRQWRRPDGEPDYNFLADCFAGIKVPVVDCSQSQSGYGAAPVEIWDARNYFTWAGMRQCESDGVTDPAGAQALYLKDWHIVKDCASLGLSQIYDAPSYLTSPMHDWLNLYWDLDCKGENDFRFCYSGVAGTSTPLHHDVLLSHSWSANICGCKRWVLFPPHVSNFLVDARGEAVPYADPGRRPAEYKQRFPRLDEAWQHRLEVVQNEGELIFVPSGWYHQVDNLTDSVSINHNWLNASNAAQAWDFLQKELASVHHTIKDLRDTFDSEEEFQAKCQQLMKANCDMNNSGWLTLLASAAEEIARVIESQLDMLAEPFQDSCKNSLPQPLEVLADEEWVAKWAACRVHSVASAALAHVTAEEPLAVHAAARLRAALAILPLPTNADET